LSFRAARVCNWCLPGVAEDEPFFGLFCMPVHNTPELSENPPADNRYFLNSRSQVDTLFSSGFSETPSPPDRIDRIGHITPRAGLLI